MSESVDLPDHECRCEGDGVTWADTSACSVHTDMTSPFVLSVEHRWDQSVAYGRGWADGRAHTLGEITSDAIIEAAVTRVPAHPIDPPYTVRLVAEALVAALTTAQERSM